LAKARFGQTSQTSQTSRTTSGCVLVSHHRGACLTTQLALLVRFVQRVQLVRFVQLVWLGLFNLASLPSLLSLSNQPGLQSLQNDLDLQFMMVNRAFQLSSWCRLARTFCKVESMK
jgi:hypothetical protein